jgi:hypothetical protein
MKCLQVSVVVSLAFAMTSGKASADWGFDGWGWMGWGAASADGLALQGAGYYAMGAGIYNLKTAEANSIDADTAKRFNDYVAQVNRESANAYTARRIERIARNNAQFNARQTQLRENPSPRDIETGDALNAAVSDLSDPRLGASAVRATNTKVPASLVASIPFITAAERITLMLERLRASIKWPDVFEGPRFEADQNRFDEFTSRIRAEALEGKLSPEALAMARSVVKDLRKKVEAQPLADPSDQTAALGFVIASSSLLDLLEKPNIGPAILELKTIQDTTIGNLLGFMHAFNLRFGIATTPAERRAYSQLFEILDTTRDQLLAATKFDEKSFPPSKPSDATEFFQSLEKGRARAAGASPKPAS